MSQSQPRRVRNYYDRAQQQCKRNPRTWNKQEAPLTTCGTLIPCVATTAANDNMDKTSLSLPGALNDIGLYETKNIREKHKQAQHDTTPRGAQYEEPPKTTRRQKQEAPTRNNSKMSAVSRNEYATNITTTKKTG